MKIDFMLVNANSKNREILKKFIGEEDKPEIIGYTMKITDNLTGESRLYVDTEYSYSEYMWSDGNYSCDCNRHLFFKRINDEEEEENFPCGETRYSAELVDQGTK